MEALRIDELARRVVEGLPPGLRSAGRDLEDNLRVLLRNALGRLDLVTREEFDVQVKVLERTRAQLEALAARVAELERAAGGATAPGTSGPSAAGPSGSSTPAGPAA
ncbi:MAG TPA: accessory factor UbiK family protein [Steroidobacteraceae bacterium]|nr:accessory factor UbiK family protein [Steroidobacteraceae bacterium]